MPEIEIYTSFESLSLGIYIISKCQNPFWKSKRPYIEWWSCNTDYRAKKFSVA